MAEWTDVGKLEAGFDFLSDDGLLQEVLNHNDPEGNDEGELEAGENLQK